MARTRVVQRSLSRNSVAIQFTATNAAAQNTNGFRSGQDAGAAAMIQEARHMLEMGQFEEAERKLNEVIKADPQSRPAFYYLNLIKELRFSRQRGFRLAQRPVDDLRIPLLRDIVSQDRITEIEKAWNPPGQREMMPRFGDPFATNNTGLTSAGRQALYRKLETIRIDQFPLEKETDLILVLKKLGDEIKRRDAGGKGVNLLFAQAAVGPAQSAGAGTVDPLTGLLPANEATANINPEKFKIKLDAPVRDVTLKQLLEAILIAAKPPEGAPANVGLKYSVEDYAIVFSQRSQETEQFYTRTFKLNPNNIALNLLNNMRPSVADEASFRTNIQIVLRSFFAKAGVEFEPSPKDGTEPAPNRKAMFYNDRTGILFVRATVEDLDRVERALHTINMAPPQIAIEVQIAEIPIEKFPQSLEDIVPTQTLVTTNEFLEPTTNKVEMGQPNFFSRLSGEVAKQLNTTLTNRMATIAAKEIIISNAQAKKLVEELVEIANADLITLPTVSTLVGSKARVTMDNNTLVITDATAKTGGNVYVNLGASVDFESTVITNNGVQCVVTASNAELVSNIPQIRVRSTTSATTILFGHTQIFLVPGKNRVPVLADVPKLGRLFRSEAATYSTKRTIILVRPTVIDAAGNPLFKEAK
jgi:hypothetical protein